MSDAVNGNVDVRAGTCRSASGSKVRIEVECFRAGVTTDEVDDVARCIHSLDELRYRLCMGESSCRLGCYCLHAHYRLV